MKTKIKSCGDEGTDFYVKKIPKANSDCICLALITIDSALKKEEIYYQQVYLK